jgi:hypothetical protein
MRHDGKLLVAGSQNGIVQVGLVTACKRGKKGWTRSC